MKVYEKINNQSQKRYIKKQKWNNSVELLTIILTHKIYQNFKN
jgi:hypothetical protein